MERIAQSNYTPSEGMFSANAPSIDCDLSPVDDVLKARLKTIGVSEHKFEMEAGDQRGTEWRIVDVGGSRFQVRISRSHLVHRLILALGDPRD